MADDIRILLVDDEASLREPLAEYLVKQGFVVEEVADAAQARSRLNKAAYDIALVDVMMPGEDGFSLCRHIVERTDIPVIFLTAKGEETERIVGLELGADDYITKPFSPRELVARIKVVLRRGSRTDRGAKGGGQPEYRFAGWTLRTADRKLIDAEAVQVPLSGGEYELLLVLLEQAGQVLSRDQLLDKTRGREAGPFDRAIDNQISRLRRKIEVDPKNPELIGTVWGGGYILQVPVERL